MKRHAIRRGGIGTGLLAAALVLAAGCQYAPPPLPRLPIQVEVENSGPLRVAVVDTVKRPVPAVELSGFLKAGVRWTYTVQFANTGSVGIRLLEVEATVESLSGVTSTRTIPLPSRVEPGGTTPVAIEAVLTTSNPAEPQNLTGVQRLVFLGRDDRGNPLRVTVRVPLV